MSAVASDWFPSGMELQNLLELERIPELEDLFSHSLRKPLDELLSRPRKNLRAQLVNLGYQIGSRFSACDRVDDSTLMRACEILELIHIGSLVVDDIQDGSTSRRGGPSIHSLYGVSVALNAGNWLYFLPFEHIEKMEIPASSRALLIRECHRMLLRAHYGQALDVGISLEFLEQRRVPEVTMAAIELKSGVLMGFALKFGALIANGPESVCQRIEVFGRKLGVALQMFDDIGNVTLKSNPEKRAEDLKLKRLSFVSAIAARELTDTAYRHYLNLISNLPESVEEVYAFFSEHRLLLRARAEAEFHIDQLVTEIQSHLELNETEHRTIRDMRDLLRSCYE